MSNAYRLDQIYNILLKKKTATVEDLAENFHVTPTTIRRDLLELEARGLIYRTRGAAFLLENRTSDANIFMDEKRRIAAAAASLICNGMSVTLDSGTSTMALAQQMMENPDLTDVNILTHSPKIALELFRRFYVSLPGGTLSPKDEFLVGPWAEEFYREINIDIAFLGSMGVYNCGGLTAPNPHQLSAKQTAARCATRRVALLDSGKYTGRGMYVYCPFQEIDTLITVRTRENESQIQRIADMGVNIVLA